jgi:nitrate/nitrite transport system substrate-binding protein
MSFAMTFPPGTHAMWMRYWLASGGIHPDKDVSLITIPPAQMVANMKVDKMDGFCVGEPWNNRAIVDGIGFTAITTQQMWKDHPEKVCAFTEEFAAKNPKTVKAVLKALHLASEHLDSWTTAKAARESSRGPPTSIVRPTSSSSGCSASTNTATARTSRIRTT